jgi:hypothetical protein
MGAFEWLRKKGAPSVEPSIILAIFASGSVVPVAISSFLSRLRTSDQRLTRPLHPEWCPPNIFVVILCNEPWDMFFQG